MLFSKSSVKVANFVSLMRNKAMIFLYRNNIVSLNHKPFIHKAGGQP